MNRRDLLKALALGGGLIAGELWIPGKVKHFLPLNRSLFAPPTLYGVRVDDRFYGTICCFENGKFIEVVSGKEVEPVLGFGGRPVVEELELRPIAGPALQGGNLWRFPEGILYRSSAEGAWYTVDNATYSFKPRVSITPEVEHLSWMGSHEAMAKMIRPKSFHWTWSVDRVGYRQASTCVGDLLEP